MRRGSRWLGVLAGALAVLVQGAPGAGAQQVRLVPMVGGYAPLDDLGSVDGVGGAVEFGKKASTLAYGVALDFASEGVGLGFRVGLMYATSSDIPVRGVGCPDCAARSTLLTTTGALVLRPVPRLLFLQPYLLAGAGAKWYDFDPARLRDQGLDTFVDSQARFTGQIGLGTELSLGPLRATVELSDYVGSFRLEGQQSGKLQNDFFLMLGLVIG